jgi:hypothetical protein
MFDAKKVGGCDVDFSQSMSSASFYYGSAVAKERSERHDHVTLISSDSNCEHGGTDMRRCALVSVALGGGWEEWAQTS